jgi:hypothetical protein
LAGTANTFLLAEGKESGLIKSKNKELGAARKPVELGAEVAAAASTP